VAAGSSPRKVIAACGEPADKVTAHHGDCFPCVRYQYGYDEAEENALKALLGGAVRAALEADIPAEHVAAAFQEAMQGFHEEEMMKA
jgi:hypothetical protein